MNKATQEVWEKTKKSKPFKKLSNDIQKALDEYKKSNEEDLEITISLKNEYLGYLI